jgi:tetratricopeptide (TPR) repeat protein
MLLAGLALAVRVFWRAEDPTWRHLGLAMVVALIAFYFQNFFGVTFRQTGAVTFFWLWLSVLALAGAGLARGGSEGDAASLRELRFRRLSFAGVAVAVLAAAAALVVLAWVVITPVRASTLVKDSRDAARNGEQAAAAGQQQTAARWFKTAAAIAQKAVEMCPYSAMGYYDLAFAEGQIGDLEQAPEAKRAWFEKAGAASRRALSLMPGSGPMYFNLGVVCRRLGNLAEAEAAFREAARLTPTAVEYQVGLADVLLAQGKLEEAESYARKVAEMAPDAPTAYRLFAGIHQAKGDLHGMVEDMKTASMKSNDPALQQQIAKSLVKVEQYREALPVCERWISLAPQSPAAYAVLAFAQYHLGELKGARDNLEKVLSLDPNERQARFFLASILIRLKQGEAAGRHLVYLAVNYPDTREGRKARAMLESASKLTAGGRQGGVSAPSPGRPPGQ